MSDLCRDDGDDAGDDDDDDITSRTSPGRMGPLAWHCLPPGIIVPAELFYYFCPCLTPAGNKKVTTVKPSTEFSAETDPENLNSINVKKSLSVRL
ncbi:hypothetical protein RUM44_009343 [Polyplax serrata]|uniref:Uncharacterized protein n=1 Tax=Polyplax serrata TaxID=468196 RepID=A0ABR1ASE1_POLSC